MPKSYNHLLKRYNDKDHEETKKLHNASLANLCLNNFSNLDDFSNLKAAVVDTEEGNSTKMLLYIGFAQENIWVINYDKQKLDKLKETYPNINIFSGWFDEFITYNTKQNIKFDVIYYDCMQTLFDSYANLYEIFNKKILTDNSIFMATISSRSNQRFNIDKIKPKKYQPQNWWSYFDHNPNSNIVNKEISWSAYYADQLIKDYANRKKYKIYQLITEEIPNPQYKRNMFCLQYSISNN